MQEDGGMNLLIMPAKEKPEAKVSRLYDVSGTLYQHGRSTNPK